MILGSKYPASKEIYEKTNNQVEKISELIFYLILKISLQFIMLPIFIGGIIVCVTTEFKSDSYMSPIAMW